MKLEVAKKWIEALRSGKYNQDHHALCRKTPDGLTFCCLGVLHDTMGGWWGIGEDNMSIALSAVGAIQMNGRTDILPHEEWERFFDPMNVPTNQESFVCLNDTYHASFAEIADMIEEAFIKQSAPFHKLFNDFADKRRTLMLERGLVD